MLKTFSLGVIRSSSPTMKRAGTFTFSTRPTMSRLTTSCPVFLRIVLAIGSRNVEVRRDGMPRGFLGFFFGVGTSE